jgi:hypothetical protein
MVRRVLFAAAAALALYGCGAAEPVDVAGIEATLDEYFADRDDGLGLYVHGVEAGGGSRVRVLTQLAESQEAEAEVICNLTTVAGIENDVDLAGVDVAAAGGRFIATCEPRV